MTPRCRWDTGHIVTAVTSAARLLTEEFADRRCLVVNDGDLTEDLNGVPTVGVDGADRAEVVLLGGAGPAFGHAELTAVFRLAGDGVPVIALHRKYPIPDLGWPVPGHGGVRRRYRGRRGHQGQDRG